MGTCNEAFPASLPEGRLTANRIRHTFRLGMPHLDGSGLNVNWLLRECAHAHWWDIAEQLDVSPSEIRDLSGNRVMASVVACVVAGDLRVFREDDRVSLELAVRPNASTGWRSESVLLSEAGSWVVVELVTAFAKRNGPSNVTLSPAEMPAELRAHRDVSTSDRALLLRSEGRAMQAAAERQNDPPHTMIPVVRPAHLNGVGLVYFANFTDFFAIAEANALPAFKPELPVHRRHLHYFRNIDPGDILEIACETNALSVEPNPCVVVRSIAKRRSDGAVVAASESVRSSSAASVEPSAIP